LLLAVSASLPAWAEGCAPVCMPLIGRSWPPSGNRAWRLAGGAVAFKKGEISKKVIATGGPDD